MCTHEHMHTHTHHPPVGGSDGQERALVPLELELQVVVGCHWVLEIEHVTSARAISALKQGCLSSPTVKDNGQISTYTIAMCETHWSNLLEAMLLFHMKTLLCVFSEALSMSVNFIPLSVSPGYRTPPLHSHPSPFKQHQFCYFASILTCCSLPWYGHEFILRTIHTVQTSLLDISWYITFPPSISPSSLSSSLLHRCLLPPSSSKFGFHPCVWYEGNSITVNLEE